MDQTLARLCLLPFGNFAPRVPRKGNHKEEETYPSLSHLGLGGYAKMHGQRLVGKDTESKQPLAPFVSGITGLLYHLIGTQVPYDEQRVIASKPSSKER